MYISLTTDQCPVCRARQTNFLEHADQIRFGRYECGERPEEEEQHYEQKRPVELGRPQVGQRVHQTGPKVPVGEHFDVSCEITRAKREQIKKKKTKTSRVQGSLSLEVSFGRKG